MARSLRIALLTYRGQPHSGGQGVYVRNLSRALRDLGHHVTVFAGQPYPPVDRGVALERVPSLDLYREPDPFRRPRLGEFRDAVDVVEYALMCTAAFPEPLTFSLRAWRALARRRGEFDIVHDNQGLGYGLLGLQAAGLPVLATIHHPIVVDRRLDLAHAATWQRRLALRRWYGFVRMQHRVARRLPRLLTVSQCARSDIATATGIPRERIDVVPIGVDHRVFRPLPHVRRVPGRIVTTASADVPLKGLVHLLEALAKVRTEREDVELVVVGKARPGGAVERTLRERGLAGAVRFVSGLEDDALVKLYASAQIAAVPSLYEGFSLPAVEAMATGTPLLATTGGALPEVVGRHGEGGLLVAPGDAEALAVGLRRLLHDDALRARMGDRARVRAQRKFTWDAAARRTAERYVDLLVARTPASSC